MTQPTKQQIINADLLIVAAESGDIEKVKQLMGASHPKAYSGTLFVAAKRGHTDIVSLLIPVAVSQANGTQILNYALEFASLSGQIDVITLLIPVSDYQETFKKMRRGDHNTEILQQCIEEYEILQQKERLIKNLDAISDNKNAIKRKL